MKGRRARLVAAAVGAFGAAAFAAASLAGTSTSPVALGDAPMSAGLEADLRTLPGVAPYGAFVHFAGGDLAEQRDLVERHGLSVTSAFPQVDALYAFGTVAEVRGLTREPAVTYLERDEPLHYYGDTAVWASRARVAQEDVSGGPYRDAVGRVLDGTGVGVAIVDSGVLATHPDLTNRIARNYKIVCSTPGLINTQTGACFGPLAFVDVGSQGTSDTTSGHGTHVAGIVAGDGTASTGPYGADVAPRTKGSFTGVAPGATLYGFGTGEAISILYSVEAFQYILDHYDEFTPRIRVVNNSWGNAPGTPYNPNSIQSKLIDKLVARGVTMVFAAGNSGGTGQADRTSGTCKSPTPGVVCVANYDDGAGAVSGTGTRNGTLYGDGTVLDSHSSRGRKGDAATYPDVSAPGTLYTAACIRGVQPVCATGIINEVRWGGVYASLTGTSMASPHAAGIVALALQARPDLTPAEVEDLLQDTAHKYSFNTTQGPNASILPGPYEPDPQNPGETTSYDKGAGLVDVPALLTAVGVAHDGATGTAQGQAAVHVDEPAAAAEFDGSAPIAVSGTAVDGVVQPAPPKERLLVAGDGGDLSGPGAADIVGLSVQETAAGAAPGGMTYRIGVRDAADLGLAPSVTLRVTQLVDGKACQSNVSITATGVVPGGGTCAPTAASREANTVSFFVPYANLGNPGPGAPAYTVFVSSFVNAIVDVAPSAGSPGAAADLNARPMFARPYTVERPQVTPIPTAAVTVSLDGGVEQAATLAGASPEYSWTAPAIDPSGLADGAHTLVARLYLNGSLAASHTTTFTLRRPVAPAYEIAITSPSDAATVPRAVVAVTGTSATNDPAGPQTVTLQVAGGGYDSGQLPATGTSPWARDVDFGSLPGGTYTLVARLLVASAVKASDSVTVIVPEALPEQVSCSPRAFSWWRNEYAGKKAVFTDAERERLAARGASLSSGYFDGGAAVTAAVQATASTPEQRAARQYAALLLNLAAGDLSRAMSYSAGLAGSEELSPKAYDTARVGTTVDAAAAWVRAQLPNGDLGGATELADAVNSGHKLGC